MKGTIYNLAARDKFRDVYIHTISKTVTVMVVEHVVLYLFGAYFQLSDKCTFLT